MHKVQWTQEFENTYGVSHKPYSSHCPEHVTPAHLAFSLSLLSPRPRTTWSSTSPPFTTLPTAGEPPHGAPHGRLAHAQPGEDVRARVPLRRQGGRPERGLHGKEARRESLPEVRGRLLLFC